jgi:cytochrome c oxidase subunit 2
VPKKLVLEVTVLTAIIAAIVTAVALLIPWLPVSASKEREGIDLTFWLATGISIFIFAIVAATMLVAVRRFRVRSGDDSDGPPIHGHTKLEIVWTAIPTALVTAIAIVSAVVLHDNSVAGRNPLRVAVTGAQFAWAFRYLNGPAAGKEFGQLRLPVDEKVKLEITAVDVIHSFWVAEFGQKQDAVPGEVNPLVITPTKVGTFPIVCTELCGIGHSLMRSEVTVMEQDEFEAWAGSAAGGRESPTAESSPGEAGDG